MCGIAGFVTSDGAPPDGGAIESMCRRLAHRGPDAGGVYRDFVVALGHRRLSIIDVAGGRQPLGNEDGSIQVVFNGEIYNYPELRREMERRGHRFQTSSDTEVLVHLYEEVGEGMPEWLNGMFAFAVWDARRQELFLARDRLGKKPLYYSFSVPGYRFCFASELSALAALPGFRPAVDPGSVADFLALGYVPDPQTIYQGVSKLRPAHCLTVTRWTRRQRRYWTPLFAAAPARLEDTVEEIRELAGDAVRRRLVSDVPLGAFLSGGLDSSAVVSWMAEQSGPVKTFSIGFTDRAYDERPYARMVADRYGTDHREEVVTPSIHDMLDTLATRFDEPFGDSSAIPMLYMARMARQHVTVALGGDGADELFGGYRRYYFGVLEERLRSAFPAWFRQSVIKLGAEWYPKFDYMPQVLRAKTLLTNLTQQLGDSYFTSMSVFRDGGLEAVLSPDIRRDLSGYSPRAAFRDRFHPLRELPPLEQMQAVDLDTYLPGDILVKADRATMAYSLESRSPWLDYRLVELACRLPAQWKISGRVGKHIFRRAVVPRLPAPILTRRKMGFSVPLAQWLRTDLRAVFESHVQAGDAEAYLSVPEVRRIWQEHQSGVHNHDRKLWSLLMLALWHHRHRRGQLPSATVGDYAAA